MNNALMIVDNLQPYQQYQIVLRAVDGGGKIGRALIVVDVREPLQSDKYTANLNNVTMSAAVGDAASVSLHSTTAAQLTVQTIVTEINEATPASSVVVSLQVRYNQQIAI